MRGVPVASVVLPVLSQPVDLDQDVRKRISLCKVANLLTRLVPLTDWRPNDEDEEVVPAATATPPRKKPTPIRTRAPEL